MTPQEHILLVRTRELNEARGALRDLRAAINSLTYCPYCGQGHAMHTADCKLLPLLVSSVR